MPIVFVHGVNNRDGQAYQESEVSRNAFLREIVAPALGLKPGRVRILSPYWGRFGVKFAWGMASLPNPSAEFESFGADADAQARGRVLTVLAEARAGGDIVTQAQTDLAGAIDLLYASAMAAATSEEDARDLARSYMRAADYAAATPHPEWVGTATPDNFVDQLNYAADASKDESFGVGGIFSSLKEGISRLFNAAPDATSALAGRLLRKNLNAAITRFAGDAFVYLDRRGNKEAPGDIVKTVLAALHEAQAARTADDDKLVVIAHSFGGEIMYDILTHFEPTLQVDCLITVGSQVGLFEEMKLYRASRPDLPPDTSAGRVVRPASLKRWLNVFDTNDVLSYRLEPIVSDVSDFFYDTGYTALGAHGGYFMRPSFYKRMAARLSKD